MGTESALTGRSTATPRYLSPRDSNQHFMHVVDATLFYSPTSGGVKRYLLAKHEWMRAHTNWRHSLVVPGEARQHIRPDDISTVAGRLVPGTFNYRLPLNPLRWSRAIDALEPDLIEIGDAFHPAWAAASVAQPARHSADRVLSLELSGARRAPARRRRAEAHRVVRAAHLRALRTGARAEPLHVRVPAQHRRRARQRAAAGRRSSRRSRPRGAGAICAPSSGCRPARACWCSPGASRRKRTSRCCSRRSASSAIPITCC